MGKKNVFVNLSQEICLWVEKQPRGFNLSREVRKLLREFIKKQDPTFIPEHEEDKWGNKDHERD